jgi:hypothetical protein
MAEIFITDKGDCPENLNYVKQTLTELFTTLSCVVEIKQLGARSSLTIKTPDTYYQTVLGEITDKLAEIIAINYKYNFFNSRIKTAGLRKLEREILFAGLISADFDEDKRYSQIKLKGEGEISLDGIFNFRMKPLKNKWQEIVNCMPTCFMPSQLKDFMSFLIENRTKKVYVDNGCVYDEHYRRLDRNTLMNGDEEGKLIKEIILSEAKIVEITGEIPQLDQGFLSEFYGENALYKKEFMTKMP